MANTTTFSGDQNRGAQVGQNYGNVNYFGNHEGATNQHMRDLLVTDPRVEKQKLSSAKDELLEGSCSWVLQDPAFLEWWNNDNFRCLWIHGDPGKGKTMMAMALIDEISHHLNTMTADSGALTYFFCQATTPGLNDAISILRGLIYVLIDKHKDLSDHFIRVYNSEKSRLFEGVYGLHALWGLLSEILQDERLPRTYLVIDALDECGTFQAELLQLLTRRASLLPSKVKWLLTSRNEPQIREELENNPLVPHTSLELNSQHVANAVQRFIDFKVDSLKIRKRLDDQVRQDVQKYLSANAHGTFLWVALVCQYLFKTKPWNILSELKRFPPGLELLYERMLRNIQQLEETGDREYYEKILRAVTLAYRPLSLDEFWFAAELPKDPFSNQEHIRELIHHCGSFLTERNNEVYFVHQSAKDFLTGLGGLYLFPSGQLFEHKRLAHRLLELLSDTLRRDICGFKQPGTLYKKVNKDIVRKYLPAHVQYACCYWVDHILSKSKSFIAKSGTVQLEPRDYGLIASFFNKNFLYWIEDLAWIGKISIGILAVTDLEICIHEIASQLWLDIHDARRFLLQYRVMLETAPLQIYSSALIFSPENSSIRQKYREQTNDSVQMLGANDEWWSACLQILQGHTDGVYTVAFSPDGQLVASGSRDCIVRLWDVKTGECRSTLQGHADYISTVVFSPDGQLVASSGSSRDCTVRLWDAKTGEYHSTLRGHTDYISTVVFSPDGQLVASGSWDDTVRLWDVKTGECHITLRGHTDHVNTVVFSPNGQEVASGSRDCTVRLWDLKTGEYCSMLRGHEDCVNAVVFSPDGQVVASSGSRDGTVRLWDVKTGECRSTLQGHTDSVSTVVFSTDGQVVASSGSSRDCTVQLWDVKTGECHSTLRGHRDHVNIVVFSPDSQLVASGSRDDTVRLWDVKTGECHITLQGHTNSVNTVVFSPDGQLVASGSWDDTVRLWDVKTGEYRSTLQGHTNSVSTVVFSPNGQLVASGSWDHTVRLWDVKTGEYRSTLRGHADSVSTVVFSPDGQLVASGSWDNTVRLWDVKTGECHSTLRDHADFIITVVFSTDCQVVASGSRDCTVRLWDVKTGECCSTLRGHEDYVNIVVFSTDGHVVASGSRDGTVRIWDVRTSKQFICEQVQTKSQLSFISDSSRLLINQDNIDPGHMETSSTFLDENSNLYLNASYEWVMSSGERILWLPPNYQPGCYQIRGQTVVIGTKSGRVIFLRFSDEDKFFP